METKDVIDKLRKLATQRGLERFYLAWIDILELTERVTREGNPANLHDQGKAIALNQVLEVFKKYNEISAEDLYRIIQEQEQNGR